MRFDPYLDDLNKRFPRRREIPPRKPVLLYVLIVAFVLLILCAVAISGNAQTVSPLVVECSLKCRGQFTVDNHTLVPFTVLIDPQTFTLKENVQDPTPVYKALDLNVVGVKVSDIAARIPPKGRHTFVYNLTCAKEPCLVTFWSGMIVGHTTQGVAVKVNLAHTVYMCTKQKGCRAQVFKQAGIVEVSHK